MKPHGWVGIAVVLTAEAALLGGQPLAARWFTPLVWTATCCSWTRWPRA